MAWQIVEQRGRLMGCECSVHVAVEPEQGDAARAAIAQVWAWLGEEVEARLTRFRPDSELMRLNAAGGRWVTASPLLFDVTQAAVRAAAATEGLFDPTVIDRLEDLGYDRDLAELSREAQSPTMDARIPESRTRAGRWQGIEMDPTRRRIRLHDGVRLDFGGIAKGWAADRAVTEHLGEFANALVSLGGDMRARGGPEPGAGWPIGVEDPRQPKQTPPVHRAILTMRTGGLATSGASGRWWYYQGMRQHHLIDPRTGFPAKVWIAPGDTAEIASATALAATGEEAEIAAKVALLLGPEAALQGATALRCEFILIMSDGNARASAGMQSLLEERGEAIWWL